MSSACEVKQVKKAFAEFECKDDLVWHSAAGLVLQLGLTASELAEQFEVFALKMKKLGEPITKQFFTTFSEHLKKEKVKENVSENRSHGASSAFKPSAAISPLSSAAKPQLQSPVPAEAAAAPSVAEDVEMADMPAPPPTASDIFNFKATPILNGGAPDVIQTPGARFRCNGPQLPVPFRTLSNILPASAAHLERRINAMEAHLRSSGWSLTAVNTSSTENVAVVGRICHNADTVTSSIATLELEGSRAGSDGARVKLDCSLLIAFSFFPGQVVGIKGRNPTGSCLTAHSVVDSCPATAGPAAAGVVEQEAGQCRIVIAAGPFVPGSGKLSFHALHAVLDRCRTVQPDTLLLCGPFIPDSHPSLKTLRIPFQELFAQQVLAPLQEFSGRCPETQVMLMPGTGDAHHLPVHPQPPMPAAANVDMLPSPAHLHAGSSAIAVSSSTVLFDLSSATIGQLAGQDRISRLFQHVLQQGHMYPMFPPALNACVDFAHTEHLDMPAAPHALVLPAPFPPCAKIVQARAEAHSSGGRTVCINPGYACKGSSGTFIDMVLPDVASPDAEKTKVSCVQWSTA